MKSAATLSYLLEGESPQQVKIDLSALDATCQAVKNYVDQVVAHHDRSRTATAPTHRELNEAVDVIVDTFSDTMRS